VIEEFGMATLKKKRKSFKRDPNQVLITKPVNALQTDGPVSAISSSVNNVNQERFFMVNCKIYYMGYYYQSFFNGDH
jgi:hypothetical protein